MSNFITGTTPTVYFSPNCTNVTGVIVTSAVERKTRKPYKKDKFNLSFARLALAGVDVKTTVGKVLTLTEIGNVLDSLQPADTLTITITKDPR